MDTSQLTFTRFIAAILIVIFHFGDQVFPFNQYYLAPFIHHAYLGVGYFFLLSGFVMVIAQNKRNDDIAYGIYLKNRAARILPLYYFALLLMLIYFFLRISLFKTPTIYHPTFSDVVLNLFLIQAWIPGDASHINTAAWSLSAEAFFYVLFPFVFNKFYRKNSIKRILFSILLLFFISQLSSYFLFLKYQQHIDYFSNLPLLHLNEFILGNLIGFIFIRQPKLLNGSFLLLLFIFILSIVAVYTLFASINLSNGLFVLFFAPLIYLIAVDQGVIAHIFRNKFLVYLGEISYGIYILQFPIYFFFTALLTYLGFKINQPLFFVYLIVLTIFSALSFQFVEKPMREKVRNWKFIYK